VRWRRWLAGSAAVAGAFAPFAGSLSHTTESGAASDQVSARAPGRPPDRAAGRAAGSIDVAELARAVADQRDHVSAVQLATWIRARLPGLRVVDVRSSAEYVAFHLPGAEHIPLEQLTAAAFSPDETIVLYSELGVHGGQAWVFLRALGHRRVFFLRNGLHEWLDDVMSPALAADASAEARAAFAQVAELSRWFGGAPRDLTGGAGAVPGGAPIARRRGC
jgi:rhodanese-related sulfurtransferase